MGAHRLSLLTMPNMRYISYILLFATLSFAACHEAPHTNPLAGWRDVGSMMSAPMPETIKQDAQNYFRSLPYFEQKEAQMDYAVTCWENDAGEHAVVLSAPKDGEHWRYALIYDKYNHRIKVLKYSTGSYMSQNRTCGKLFI